MVETIPDERAVVVVRGQPADLGVAFEHGHGVPPVGEPVRERHPREAAADDADSHDVDGSPRCQAMVRARPSSSPTVAFTPRIRSQRETSGTRRRTSS